MEEFYMEVQYVVKLGVFAFPTPPELIGVTGNPEVAAVTKSIVTPISGVGHTTETTVYVTAKNQTELVALTASAEELAIRIKGSKVCICKVSHVESRVGLSATERKVIVSCPVLEIDGQKVGGGMAVAGSTIKLRAEFYDFNGALCNPEAVNFRVYDCNERQIGETVAVPLMYRTSTGVYEYLYVVPNGLTELTYEFEGIIEGNPSIGRGTLNRTFGV